jgi:hypothetical protein
MGNSKKVSIKKPPAKTPAGRENQLVSLAMDEAEKRIRDGTATSQVLTHFLKIASTKEQLEKEILKTKNDLMKAQVEAVQSAAKVEELYKNALNAMKIYSGNNDRGVEDEEL